MKYIKLYEDINFFDEDWDEEEFEKDFETYYLIGTVDGIGKISTYISTKNKKERGKFNALKFGVNGINIFGVFRESVPVLNRVYKLVMNGEYDVDYIGDNGDSKSSSIKDLMDKYNIRNVIPYDGKN